jgi:hypothetical protein
LIFNWRMWLSVLKIDLRYRSVILFKLSRTYHLRPPLLLPSSRYLIGHR